MRGISLIKTALRLALEQVSKHKLAITASGFLGISMLTLTVGVNRLEDVDCTWPVEKWSICVPPKIGDNPVTGLKPPTPGTSIGDRNDPQVSNTSEKEAIR